MDRSFRTPSRTISRSSSYTDRSQSTLGYLETSNANISVIARFRPLNGSAEQQTILQDYTDTQCQIKIAESVSDFAFDRILGPEATQTDVFDYCRSTVADVLAGFNGTILAYGQSGAGKTTTLMGPDLDGPQRGLIPRIVDHIWAEKTSDHKCSVAYFEIYNERVKDLMDPSQDNLPVHENSGGGFYVKNLTWTNVETVDQVHATMEQGNTNRAVAATGCNSQSSRSHSLFAIQISHNNRSKGLLYLVDLAGSEKVSKTRATGKVLEEAKSINRSLSTLGMVINSLTDPKIGHVPYRDSKLTRILQESLGGNARTTLIIHCAPCSQNSNETLSTLRFGTRAKAVRNRPIINIDAETLRMQLLKQELLKWRAGVEVPVGDRVELELQPKLYERPSSSLSSLSSLSYHERRKSLTSPRAFNDSSPRPKQRILPEEPPTSEIIEAMTQHLLTSTQIIRAQNGQLASQNIRLSESEALMHARATSLEKQLALLESNLEVQGEKLHRCLENLGPRISMLNIY